MKYLVVNCGYNNSIKPITSIIKSELAFTHNTKWDMPQLYMKDYGMALPDESKLPTQFKGDVSDTNILKKVIPGGIDFGIVCFRFSDSDQDGLTDAIAKLTDIEYSKINNFSYKSFTVVEL